MSSTSKGHTLEFGHVGFHVQDLDRSVSYYRNVIGLELVDQLVRDEPYLSQVTGYPQISLKIALLVESNSRVMLELIEYPSGLGTPIDTATANPGTGHVCFVVDDVDRIYERAIDAGYPSVNPPVTPTKGMWVGGRSIYMLDPDGIRVELVQRDPAATG